MALECKPLQTCKASCSTDKINTRITFAASGQARWTVNKDSLIICVEQVKLARMATQSSKYLVESRYCCSSNLVRFHSCFGYQIMSKFPRSLIQILIEKRHRILTVLAYVFYIDLPYKWCTCCKNSQLMHYWWDPSVEVCRLFWLWQRWTHVLLRAERGFSFSEGPCVVSWWSTDIRATEARQQKAWDRSRIWKQKLVKSSKSGTRMKLSEIIQ
jgi:hypothetical protein